ncbi:hypothetical protein [Ramlibacter sp. 2FC]|uniref:lipopolysaccharide biosynthesis protein n=1 Tax=Ramlibacter sp. 2FC TaxID=2502188 RepID=UPI0010F497AA|nr:hypothetical protein [Ramlibacter sp. 2FC]
MMVLREILTARRLKQLWYLPLLATAMGLMMLRILAMARVLDVAGFGTYSAGLLVSGTFCMLGCLGLQSMLQRDMPVMLMRHRSRAALVLLLQCLLVALACAAVGVLSGSFVVSVAGLPSVAVTVGIVHGLSQQAFLLVTVESRSRGEPLRYAFQNFWRAASILVTSLVVADLTGSAVMALLAEAAVSIALSHATLGRIVRETRVPFAGIVAVSLRRLGQIRWRTALVLLLVSVVGFLHVNADRWAAAEALAPDRFALYAFAAIVLTVAQSVQSMINASVYPMLSRRCATAGPRVAFRLCAALSIATLAGGLVLAIPGLVAAGHAIDWWFPDYRASTGLLTLFFSIAVLRVSDFWSSFLMISGHEIRLLVLDGLVLTIGVAVWMLYLSGYRSQHSDLAIYGMLAVLLASGHYLCSAAMAWRILHRSHAASTALPNY